MAIIERVAGGFRNVTVDVTGAVDSDGIVRVAGFFRPGTAGDLLIGASDVQGLQALLDAKLDDVEAGTGLATLDGGTLTPGQLCAHTHPMSDVVGLAASQSAQDTALSGETGSRVAADSGLNTRVTALEGVVHWQVRGATVAVPAIALLTTVDVPVAWAAAMPNATYSIGLALEAVTGLLGQLRAVVKPGTVTAAGFTASMSSGSVVSIGQATLHAQAIDF